MKNHYYHSATMARRVKRMLGLEPRRKAAYPNDTTQAEEYLARTAADFDRLSAIEKAIHRIIVDKAVRSNPNLRSRPGAQFLVEGGTK